MKTTGGSICLIPIAVSSIAGPSCRKPWFGSCEEKSMTAFGTTKRLSGAWTLTSTRLFRTMSRQADSPLIRQVTCTSRSAARRLTASCTNSTHPTARSIVLTTTAAFPRTTLSGSVPRIDQCRLPDTRCGVLGTAPLRVWRLTLKAALSGHRKWDRVVATRSTGSLQAAIMAGRCTPKASITMASR